MRRPLDPLPDLPARGDAADMSARDGAGWDPGERVREEVATVPFDPPFGYETWDDFHAAEERQRRAVEEWSKGGPELDPATSMTLILPLEDPSDA